MAQHDFKTLFAEFLGQEWASPATLARRELWLDARDEARSRWARVLQLRARNQSYTDAVLEGMLPYADAPANRARNRWIHPSSTLSVDVRAWFEREGWVSPTGWPMAAHAVVQLIERCMLCPEKLQEVCDRFVQHPEARGFQASLVSPVLNALVPDRFLVVTARSLAMLRAFTGVPWSPRMETYPRANEAMRAFLASQRVVIDCPATRGHRPADVLDLFATWFVARTADDHDEAWDRLQAATQEARELPCWKVSPGDQTPRWFKCLADQSVAFAWPELGDLTALSREEFHQRIQALAIDREEYRLGGVEHLWRIAHSPRAVLVAARGTDAVLGVGRVTGRYEFVGNDRFPHRVPVDWFDTTERAVRQPEWSRPVVGVDLEQVEELLALSLSGVYERETREESGEVATSEAPPALAASGDVLSTTPRHSYSAPAMRRDPEAGSSRPGVLPGPMIPVPSLRGPSQPAQPLAMPARRLRPASDPPPNARLTTAPSVRMVDPPAPRKGGTTGAPRSLARLSEETSFHEDDLRRWLEAARRRGGALFSGPTGCGKTFLALRLARFLAGPDGVVEVVQMHPGYRYEDFVERVGDKGFAPGRFAEFVERARDRTTPSVLVVDDLQRADALRVFGEAIHAIEHREQSVRLASGSELSVPREAVILATLNTSERPLTAVEGAVRRLFAAAPLGPRYDALARYHQARGFDPSGLVLVLQGAARAVVHPELAVGAASFFVDDLPRHLEDIWNAEVVPHLAQHLDVERLKPFRWDRVRATLLHER
ncbi:MAG: AAA family ATPase [Polyangiales bacterium]